MYIARSGAFLALACLWSTTATGIAPATPEQMVCVPAVFVVATVTDESPSLIVPENCKEDHRSFCVFKWPLTVKVNQVLAARPSDFSLKEISGFQSGSILHVRVRVRTSRYSEGVAPDDGQGGMSAPFLSRDGSANPLRQKNFIFGLVDFGDRTSQIWSMSFQGRLEKRLIESVNGQRQDQLQCPRLMN
jgi:hypothetical protein